MDRRLAGIALVVVVLLAAIAVGSPNGRRVAGSADRVPLPPVPVVGSCVSGLPQHTQTGWRFQQSGYLSATTVPCVNLIDGEIVAVDSGALPPDDLGSESYRRDGPLSRCYTAIGQYAGLSAGTGRATLPGDHSDPQFYPIMPVLPLVIGPNDQDRDAGARWSACVVAPRDGSAYPGTMRNALAGGSLPPQFSLCLPTADVYTEGSSCTVPHRVEVLGYTNLVDGPQAQDGGAVDRACVQFVARITGSSALADDPALTIDGVTNDFSALHGACVVTAVGDRRLQGTVVGIGDRPLPWVD